VEKIVKYAVCVLALLFSSLACAEANVLDFQDQVIEGTVDELTTEVSGGRKGSPVFDELGKGDSSMDSIVFRRADFNDFHSVQMNQRVYIQSTEDK
jgi:hypothetical protein